MTAARLAMLGAAVERRQTILWQLQLVGQATLLCIEGTPQDLGDLLLGLRGQRAPGVFALPDDPVEVRLVLLH